MYVLDLYEIFVLHRSSRVGARGPIKLYIHYVPTLIPT